MIRPCTEIAVLLSGASPALDAVQLLQGLGFADDQSTVLISFVHSARKYITASAAGQCHRQVHACKSLSDKR